MRTYTVTMYSPEDCEALDNMGKKEVAFLLATIEGSYMPKKPGGYYSGEELDESDYSLLRYCKALELAAKWLREESENDV